MAQGNNWRDDYPAGLTIPPDDAAEIDETLFRFVRNQQPDESDFLPSFKDPKQKHLVKKPMFRKNPGFYGTSFFKTESKIKQIERGNPERFAENYIAKGEVKPFHGKGKHERSKHVSVWFYAGLYPKGFKVI